MSQRKYVEAGRLVFLRSGADKGKLAVIVDILSTSGVLVEGPTTGVARQVVSLRGVVLTDEVVEIGKKPTSAELKEQIEASGAVGRFMESADWKVLSAPYIRDSLSWEQREKIPDLLARRKAAIKRIKKSLA
ncbi:Ribosomal protein L14 [Giardia muris]|uniref:Ribosomal protein L14 n=1 Tax=Giardia muris TaxID=5742 RepID=A0A4Z1SY75_GIAMU|nr:Ribosomal protein L14 [Giardia muris]|eukprot:TNJ30702.1 Ribosomal protein L14 [Giardia muris]